MIDVRVPLASSGWAIRNQPGRRHLRDKRTQTPQNCLQSLLSGTSEVDNFDRAGTMVPRLTAVSSWGIGGLPGQYLASLFPAWLMLVERFQREHNEVVGASACPPAL